MPTLPRQPAPALRFTRAEPHGTPPGAQGREATKGRAAHGHPSPSGPVPVSAPRPQPSPAGAGGTPPPRAHFRFPAAQPAPLLGSAAAGAARRGPGAGRGGGPAVAHVGVKRPPRRGGRGPQAPEPEQDRPFGAAVSAAPAWRSRLQGDGRERGGRASAPGRRDLPGQPARWPRRGARARGPACGPSSACCPGSAGTRAARPPPALTCGRLRVVCGVCGAPCVRSVRSVRRTERL